MRDVFGHILPSVLAVVFVLVMQGAVPLFAPTTALPHMAALMVIFWSLYRPSAMPAWVVLLLGLMLDVLHGQPLGMEASMLLSLRVLIEWRLRIWAERPFAAQWLLVGLLLAAAFIIKGWVQEIYLSTGISWSRTGVAWFFSILCYPLIHMLCSWVYLALPRHGTGISGAGQRGSARHESRR